MIVQRSQIVFSPFNPTQISTRCERHTFTWFHFKNIQFQKLFDIASSLHSANYWRARIRTTAWFSAFTRNWTLFLRKRVSFSNLYAIELAEQQTQSMNARLFWVSARDIIKNNEKYRTIFWAGKLDKMCCLSFETIANGRRFAHKEIMRVLRN